MGSYLCPMRLILKPFQYLLSVFSLDSMTFCFRKNSKMVIVNPGVIVTELYSGSRLLTWDGTCCNTLLKQIAIVPELLSCVLISFVYFSKLKHSLIIFDFILWHVQSYVMLWFNAVTFTIHLIIFSNDKHHHQTC